MSHREGGLGAVTAQQREPQAQWQELMRGHLEAVLGVQVQTRVFIQSLVGILNSKDSVNTCFLCFVFSFPFLKQYESISSTVHSDLAQGKSLSLPLILVCQKARKIIPSLIDIPIN